MIYLQKKCKHARHTVKRRIIQDNILEYECSKCGIDKWDDKDISLQLDHINGINDDNRLENLRFLCPNCHSQTDSFCGKGKIGNKQYFYCEKCGCEITKFSKGRCNQCRGKQHRKFEVTKEKLQELMNKYPFTKIGEMFGVTDNSIRKRCQSLEIKIPKRGRGYWTKYKNKSPV